MFLFVRLNEQLGKFAKSITQATCYLGEGEGWFMKTLHFTRHESSLRWVHTQKKWHPNPRECPMAQAVYMQAKRPKGRIG